MAARMVSSGRISPRRTSSRISAWPSSSLAVTWQLIVPATKAGNNHIVFIESASLRVAVAGVALAQGFDLIVAGNQARRNFVVLADE